jgi:hypothetical protein
MTLRIFGISRPGLVALSLAVAALWTCLGMEKAALRQADRDAVASIRTLARLRRITEGNRFTAPARVTAPAFSAQPPFSS